MKFQHKSHEQIADSKLLKESSYKGFIERCEEKTNTFTGILGLNFTFKLWDQSGKEWILFDFMSEANLDKLISICEATDNLAHYEADEVVPGHFIGKTVILHVIRTKEWENKEGKTIASKNKIENYSKNKEADLNPSELNSDIPF